MRLEAATLFVTLRVKHGHCSRYCDLRGVQFRVVSRPPTASWLVEKAFLLLQTSSRKAREEVKAGGTRTHSQHAPNRTPGNEEGGLWFLGLFLGPVLPPGKGWQILGRGDPGLEPLHLFPSHMTSMATLDHMRTPRPKGRATCPRCQNGKWKSQGVNPSWLTPKPASPQPHRILPYPCHPMKIRCPISREMAHDSQ